MKLLSSAPFRAFPALGSSITPWRRGHLLAVLKNQLLFTSVFDRVAHGAGVTFVGRFSGVAIILPLTRLGVPLLLILSDQHRRAYAARRTTE